MDDMFSQIDQISKGAEARGATGRSGRAGRVGGKRANVAQAGVQQEEEKLDFDSIMQQPHPKEG